MEGVRLASSKVLASSEQECRDLQQQLAEADHHLAASMQAAATAQSDQKETITQLQTSIASLNIERTAVAVAARSALTAKEEAQCAITEAKEEAESAIEARAVLEQSSLQYQEEAREEAQRRLAQDATIQQLEEQQVFEAQRHHNDIQSLRTAYQMRTEEIGKLQALCEELRAKQAEEELRSKQEEEARAAQADVVFDDQNLRAGAVEANEGATQVSGEVEGAKQASDEASEAKQAATESLRNVMRDAQMIHDYDGSAPNSLGLQAGDNILVEVGAEHEWWWARDVKTGLEGWVPSTHIRLKETAPASHDVESLSSETTRSTDSVDSSMVEAHVIFDFRGSRDDGSQMEGALVVRCGEIIDVDPGEISADWIWAKSRVNSAQGWIPASSVNIL